MFGNPNIKRRNVAYCKLRFKILVRDDFKCQYCGRSIKDGAILQVDHVIPRSRGGFAVPGNLKTSCYECNMGKSDFLIDIIKNRRGKKVGFAKN